jgi:PAS domain S-box-containing protein
MKRKQIEESLRKRAVELEVAAQVSVAVSTILDSAELLQTVVELTQKSFNLNYAHIFLFNQDNHSLRLAASAGEIGRQLLAEDRPIWLNQELSIIARAARTRQGVIVNDTRQNPDYLPHPLLPDIRSEMAAPMIVGDKLLGVFDVQSITLNRFDQDDERIHTILTAQIAVALENARRFEQVQKIALEHEQTKQFLDSIIENLPHPIFIKEAKKLRHVLWNKANEEMVGLNRAEAMGKQDHDLFHKRYADFYKAKDEEALAGGKVIDISEQPIHTSTGEIRYLRTRKIPILAADGKPAYLLGMSEDITERIRLEEQIQKSLEHRGRQVQTITEVAQQIAAAPALDELFQRVVDLIQARFGYYHVHVYTLEEFDSPSREGSENKNLESKTIVLDSKTLFSRGTLSAEQPQPETKQKDSPKESYLIVQTGAGEAGRMLKAAQHKIALTAEKSLVAKAARTALPVRVWNVSLEPDWLPNALLPDTRSELAVPIKLGNKVLGVLDVQSDSVGGLTEEDQLLLLGLCGQIAVAIDYRRAETERRQAIGSLRQSEEIVRALINAPIDSMLLLERDGVILALNEVAAQRLGKRVEELVGTLVYDLFSPDVTRFRKTQAEEVLRSGQAIRYEDQREGMWFDHALYPVLDATGKPTRLAIFSRDITQRKQAEATAARRAEEMTALYQTSLEISSELEISSLLQAIAQRAATLLKVDMGTLVLSQADNETLKVVAVYNRPHSDIGVTVKWGEGVTGRIAQTGEPLAIADYRHWPERTTHFANEPVGRILGVPLKQGQQVIGVLNVFDEKSGEFEQSDIQLLSLFATFATITLQNAHLFESERRQREITEMMGEVARAVNSSLELETVLDETLLGLEKIIPYDTAHIMLLEQEQGRIVAGRGYREASLVGSALPLTQLPIANKVIHHQQPLLISDMHQEPLFKPPVQDAVPVRSLIYVPLISRRQVMGLLGLASYAPYTYSAEDVNVAFRFALQVSAAIENARLFESERAQLRLSQTLQAVGALLTTQMDLDDVFETIFDLLAQVIVYDSVSIQLLAPGGDLELAAGRGFPDFEEARQNVQVAARQRPGNMWLEQKMMVISDTWADDRWIITEAGAYIRSWIGAALIVRGELLGLLTVDGKTPHRYQESDGETVTAFANQAAVAILNARMFAQQKQAEESLKHYSERLEDLVEERTGELKVAQEQLIRQEKLAVLGQLAGGVGHELRNPLSVITNALYYLNMILGETDETVTEYLQLIGNRVKEADKIVSDLLNLSRTKPAAKETVAAPALLAESLRRYPPPDHITINSDIAPDLPAVLVDPQQIGQVLGNLITNAYQAMPAGGVLTIAARLTSREAEEDGSRGESAISPPLPRPSASRPLPNYVTVSITDTGVGMSPEVMANIFEPLYTTKARGIGLGLVVCKNLVEVNGGQIRVTSVENKGSTFTITLPIAQQERRPFGN